MCDVSLRNEIKELHECETHMSAIGGSFTVKGVPRDVGFGIFFISFDSNIIANARATNTNGALPISLLCYAILQPTTTLSNSQFSILLLSNFSCFVL